MLCKVVLVQPLLFSSYLYQWGEDHGVFTEGCEQPPEEGGWVSKCRTASLYSSGHQMHPQGPGPIWPGKTTYIQVQDNPQKKMVLHVVSTDKCSLLILSLCSAVNIMLSVTWSSMTSLAVGQWLICRGIPLEGCTDLDHDIANGNLTAVGYWDEILRAIVRPYAGAVDSEFLLVQDNSWPHVASVCMTKAVSGWWRHWCHLLALTLPIPTSGWPPIRLYVLLHLMPLSSLMPWSKSGRRSPRTPSADSSGACSDLVGSAYRHEGPYAFMSCRN